MSPELETLLSRAYDLDQMRSDPAGAVAEIKAKLGSDPGLATEAAAELVRLTQIVEARQMDGRHGDHVSAVLCAVLTKALA